MARRAHSDARAARTVPSARTAQPRGCEMPEVRRRPPGAALLATIGAPKVLCPWASGLMTLVRSHAEEMSIALLTRCVALAWVETPARRFTPRFLRTATAATPRPGPTIGISPEEPSMRLSEGSW